MAWMTEVSVFVPQGNFSFASYTYRKHQIPYATACIHITLLDRTQKQQHYHQSVVLFN